MRPLNSQQEPLHVRFDPTPEIFATDSKGRFRYPLLVSGKAEIETKLYDEARFVFSLWHPAANRTIDLDRTYVELGYCLDQVEDHWVKLAEIEPVVPPYSGGETFDGWIVLPILGAETCYVISGSGFAPRARLQIRASSYLVA